MKLMKRLWKSRAVWTLADQCLVSGSTLLVNILIVSQAGLIEFGTYSMYWLIILLIGSFHQSLIIIPFYTFFAKVESFERYFRQLLKLQLQFSILAFIVTGGICISLAYCGFSVPFWHVLLVPLLAASYCFQDFLRRVFFARKEAVSAFVIDLISEVLPLAILVILPRFVPLNISTVLLVVVVMKIASVIIAIVLVSPKLMRSEPLNTVRKMHWESGKYLVASNGLQWLSGNAFILVSGFLLGPVSIGVLRIAQSILGIINVFLLFLENRIPVEAARLLHNSGQKAFNQFMLRESRRYFLLLLVSLTLLSIFHAPVTRFFFGASMDDFPFLIPAFCLLYVFIYVGTMLRFVFRTLDRNEVLFYGYLVSAVVGISSVYPVINSWGVIGAVTGLFISQLATITTYLIFLKKQL